MKRFLENKTFIFAFKILCVLTVVTPCIGFFMGIAGAMIQNVSSGFGGYSYLGMVLVASGKYLIWFAPLILIITIVAWVVARFCSDKAKHNLPKMGIVFVLTLFAWFAVGVFAPQIHCQGVLACHFKLRQLYSALQQYAEEDPNNQYPTPERWCDLLMEKTNLNVNAFRCPRNSKGPCSYALNPDACFDSDEDVIVLFETDPGWNQHGQQELLRFKNHKDIMGKYANQVIKNGHVFRIEPEDLNELTNQSIIY